MLYVQSLTPGPFLLWQANPFWGYSLNDFIPIMPRGEAQAPEHSRTMQEVLH